MPDLRGASLRRRRSRCTGTQIYEAPRLTVCAAAQLEVGLGSGRTVALTERQWGGGSPGTQAPSRTRSSGSESPVGGSEPEQRKGRNRDRRRHGTVSTFPLLRLPVRTRELEAPRRPGRRRGSTPSGGPLTGSFRVAGRPSREKVRSGQLATGQVGLAQAGQPAEPRSIQAQRLG